MATELALQLLPASLRGVPFHVVGAEGEFGRRTQVHEYPQRDKPYAEDLGRATRGIRVEALLVGLDYIDQANAFIAAVEAPGPATLVHPWLGTMQVSLRNPARVRFDSGLGQAVVSLDLVEAGELTFPSATISSQAQSQTAADELAAAAGDGFADVFSTDSLPAFVSDMAASQFDSALGALQSLGGAQSPLAGWVTQLGGWADQAVSLFDDVAALAGSLLDQLDLSDIVAALAGADVSAAPTYASAALPLANVGSLGGLVQAIVAVAGTGGAGGTLGAPAVPVGLTPARRQQVLNTGAINALVRQAMLAQAVGISSVIDVTVQADAYAARDALCNALDLESLQAGDAVYPVLQAARRAVWADLTARASQSARLVSTTPGEVLPALVLAYDLYEDASRADEIAARNRIAHPGFLPPIPLQVLSR